MRSANEAATFKSWMATMTAVFWLWAMFCSFFRIMCWQPKSKFATGSSSRSRGLCCTRERAMRTLWNSPPDRL